MDWPNALPLVEPKWDWDAAKGLEVDVLGFPNSDPKEEPKMLSFVLNPPDFVNKEFPNPCFECDSI